VTVVKYRRHPRRRTIVNGDSDDNAGGPTTTEARILVLEAAKRCRRRHTIANIIDLDDAIDLYNEARLRSRDKLVKLLATPSIFEKGPMLGE
jgi:hypothetical protein